MGADPVTVLVRPTTCPRSGIPFIPPHSLTLSRANGSIPSAADICRGLRMQRPGTVGVEKGAPQMVRLSPTNTASTAFLAA